MVVGLVFSGQGGSNLGRSEKNKGVTTAVTHGYILVYIPLLSLTISQQCVLLPVRASNEKVRSSARDAVGLKSLGVCCTPKRGTPQGCAPIYV